MGGVDFSNLSIIVKEAVEKKPAVLISYGKFIQTLVDFTIIAFAIFMAVKAINSIKKKEAAAPEVPSAPSKEEVLLAEIRDLLKEKR